MELNDLGVKNPASRSGCCLSRSLRRRRRKGEPERCRRARHARDFDVSPVRFDDALGDVQPKPEALAGDGARRLTTEPLEQRRHQFRRDAGTSIADRHDHAVWRAFDVDRHVGIWVTITKGVGEKVVEDLMNPVVIGADRVNKQYSFPAFRTPA